MPIPGNHIIKVDNTTDGETCTISVSEELLDDGKEQMDIMLSQRLSV